MHTIEYQELSQRSRETGDAFYKCLSKWLADPFDKSARNSCMEHGHEYEKVLIRQIEYLRKLQPTASTRSAVEACQMYLSALESQLHMLEAAFKRGN